MEGRFLVETETGYITTGIKELTGTITDVNNNTVKTQSVFSENAAINVSFDRTGGNDTLEIISIEGQQESDDEEINQNACKYCGQIHEGFWGKFVGFFHKIAYFLAHLFGKM